MEEPTPVDVSKLKNILAASKAIMKKSDMIKPIALSGTALKEPETYRTPINEDSHQEIDYSDEQVRNSNLPEPIKLAMIKDRVPKIKPPSNTFDLEDMDDLIEKKPIINSMVKRTVTESRNNNSDLITISKTQLDDLIQEKLTNFLLNSYNKTLIENTINKTIKTLINEGKLATVKKKTL